VLGTSSANTTLLGSTSQFCATFFHADSWEAEAKPVRKGAKTQAVLVARLVRSVETGASSEEQEIYVARYASCMRGSVEAAVHAEEFLLGDEVLHNTIVVNGHTQPLASGSDDEEEGADERATTSSGGGCTARLLLYMAYPPTHPLGKTLSRDAPDKAADAETPDHGAACTERLREWYRRVLQPRGVPFNIVVADVHSAWEDAPSQSLASATREGVRILLDEGVAVRSMEFGDWSFLVSLCDSDVREAWERRGQPQSGFSERLLALRQRKDTCVERYIAECAEDHVAR
jgi:hypothetical protein